MDTFKMFVSHRPEDAAIAVRLANTFHHWCAPMIQVTLSQSLVDVREQSHENIKEVLRETNLFLLLLTAPSELSSGWDWSLYEFGLFFGLCSSVTDARKRIFTLSPSNLEVPPRLQNIEHIKAVPNEVIRFLRDVFRDAGLTGRLDYFDAEPSELERMAGEICALLAPLQVGARMHANYLVLKFPQPIREPEIPENVEVEGDAMSLKMFGLLEREQWCWGDIQHSLMGETTWVSELGKAIHAICNGRYAKPIKSTLSSSEGGSFLPVVYRDETRSSGLRLFHVLFVPTDVVPVDPELVFVITAFRSDMEPIYKAIETAVSKYSLSAKRVKDIVGDYRITDKILTLICQAKYVVADLTHERPNVYFELGYARGLGKTVITTARKDTTVHFDVKDWTYIEYDDSQTLEDRLIERFEAEGGAAKKS